jgi:hypothetical protein
MSALAVSSAYSKGSSGSFIDAPQDPSLLALLSQRLRQDRRVFKPGPPIVRQPRELRELSTSIERYQALIRLFPPVDSHRSDAEGMVGQQNRRNTPGSVICRRKAHFILGELFGKHIPSASLSSTHSLQPVRRTRCVLN